MRPVDVKLKVPLALPIAVPAVPVVLISTLPIAVRPPIKLAAPLTPSVPPKAVAPVPTVRVLALVTLVLPLKLTVPLPVLKLPVPVWVRLPLNKPLTADKLPLLSTLARVTPAEFCKANKSALAPGVTPERITATGEVALPAPWANKVLWPAAAPTKLKRPLLVMVFTPTKLPSSYRLELAISRAASNLAM